MGLFTKGSSAPKAASPAAKRAALLPTPDLVPWAETCLYQIGRSLLDYQRSADESDLGEAAQALETLNALFTEITARSGEAAVGGSFSTG